MSTQLNLAKDYLAASGAVQRVMATIIFPKNNTFFFYKTVHCNKISGSIVPVHADMFSHFTLGSRAEIYPFSNSLLILQLMPPGLIA